MTRAIAYLVLQANESNEYLIAHRKTPLTPSTLRKLPLISYRFLETKHHLFLQIACDFTQRKGNECERGLGPSRRQRES